MKKYVVINKATQQVFGKFCTQNQASEELVRYITENNENHCPNEAEFLSIFDFEVKEEEVQEIENYEDALEFLDIEESYRVGKMRAVWTTPNHYKALLALSKLFTIAEAWNKEDGFVPDFSNEVQLKYFPRFEYNNDVSDFVCEDRDWTASALVAHVGSRLCFATRERAIAFGKKFEGLYNDFLLMQ